MGIMEIVVPDLVYEEMKTVAPDNESFVAYVNFNKTSDIDKMMSEYVANFRTEHNEELQYVLDHASYVENIGSNISKFDKVWAEIK